MNLRCFTSICPAACLCILALVGSAACEQTRPEPVLEHQQEQVDAVPSPIGDRQTLDEAVIEAVLDDLIRATDRDSETLRREQGPGKLLFSSQSRLWVGPFSQEFASAESDRWKTLSLSDRHAAKDAAAMLIDRMERKQYVHAFRPKDTRISLWQDDPASTQPIEAWRFKTPRPICAAPPGYSDQNRLAVVALGFAWSMHSGDATYVLRFDGRKWNVISRHFAYYV